MKIADTHTHVYLNEFDEDRDAVIQAAQDAGVDALILPNVDASTVEPLLTLCQAYPQYAYPLMGLHPTSVNADYVEQLKTIENALGCATYYGIGEIGIDLYWDQTFRKEQQVVFEEQLRWSKELGLPVSVHTRKAFGEVMDSIYKVGAEELRGVFHCFGGSKEELQKVIQLKGFMIGVGGTVTYKKSKLPEVLGYADINRILLETDAPFLTPQTHRGQRNQPVYLWEIAKKVAEIFQITTEMVAKNTRFNTLKMFNI